MTRRTLLSLVVAGAAILLAAVAWSLSRDPNERSAELGQEGVRTFAAAPDDLPGGIVPPGATDVEGTATASGPDWTAAVTFVMDGARDDVQPHVHGVLVDAGYEFRQRSYDDVILEELYAGADGTAVTVTYRTIDEGTGTAVVLQGRR